MAPLFNQLPVSQSMNILEVVQDIRTHGRSLPPCSGAVNYWGEFDCNAVSGSINCDNCLANWHACGGTVHPESGVNYPRLLCSLLYGSNRLEDSDGN